MTKISGVIITYNEENFIEKCLESLTGVVDEVVVVDSFSTDRTKEICLKYNVKFVENKFEGFTTQKNFANDQASFDYILSLDADEALSQELKESILEAKANLQFDGYSFNRLNNYCGKWIKYSNWYPDNKIRLFNRHKASWKGENNLHEIIVLDNVKSHKNLSGDLLHWAYDSIDDHYKKVMSYTNIVAQNAYNRNPNKSIGLSKIVLNPFWKFFKNYFIKKGFLDGYYGFMICCFASFGTFLKYAKIKELQKKNKAQV